MSQNIWAVFDNFYTQLSPTVADEQSAYKWLSENRNRLTSQGTTRFHIKPYERKDFVEDVRLIDPEKEKSAVRWMRTRHSSGIRHPVSVRLTIMATKYSAIEYRGPNNITLFYVLGEPPSRWLDNRNVLFHLNEQCAPEFAVWGHVPDALIGPKDLKHAPFGAYFVLGEWDARTNNPINKHDAWKFTRYNFWADKN